MLLSLKRPGANAAVTVVHTGVPNWADYTRRADIVVGAAGVPNMIGPDAVRPGAAVVGGGISWEGKRLVSDVDESVAEVAGWVTPRLGGVGPTTVAMLLRNAVDAATRRRGLDVERRRSEASLLCRTGPTGCRDVPVRPDGRPRGADSGPGRLLSSCCGWHRRRPSGGAV